METPVYKSHRYLYLPRCTDPSNSGAHEWMEDAYKEASAELTKLGWGECTSDDYGHRWHTIQAITNTELDDALFAVAWAYCRPGECDDPGF